MGLINGSLTVATTVSVTGRLAPPGTAINNPLPARSVNSTGGASQSLSFGTTSGRADVFCDGQYLLAAGASLTLNLYDGGATDSDLLTVFKTAANLRVLKSLVVSIVDGGDTAGVTIGAASSNEFVGYFGAAGDTLTIYPDGPSYAVGSPAGKAVGSSTKNVKILNNGAVEVTVQVFAAGATVATGYWTGFWGFLTYG